MQLNYQMRSFYIYEMVLIIIFDSYYYSKDRKLAFWISKKWGIDLLRCVHFLLLYLNQFCCGLNDQIIITSKPVSPKSLEHYGLILFASQPRGLTQNRLILNSSYVFGLELGGAALV